jgi:hypothetical protein
MDESDCKIILNINFGRIFAQEFIHFPKDDQLKIFNFVNHLKFNGFVGLPGRNKESTNVSADDHLFLIKVKFARENNLYHYHIGIPVYDETKPTGDWTSKYILHYSYLDTDVKIIEMSQHPPFNLPATDYLK